MRYIIEFSNSVELWRIKEIANTPACHYCKVFERSPNDYWLETNEYIYRLIINDESKAIGAQSNNRPCAQFIEITEFLSINISKIAIINTDEKNETEWPAIEKKYGLKPYPPPRPIYRSASTLSGVECEVLAAIRLLTSNSDGWIEVDLFRHAFARNLSTTLHSLSRKNMIEISPDSRAVRLRPSWPTRGLA